MKTLGLFLSSLLMLACAHAQNSGILRGNDLQPVDLAEAVRPVAPGSIVVIGENHGFKEHQNQQLSIMQALRAQGLKVSVGMEFFTYTDQPVVDSYRQGLLSETDFLSQIKWGNPSYDYYRGQSLFPNLSEGSKTIALNAPRSLTGKVSKGGLQALTPDDLKLMPPQFAVGNDGYKRRFLSMMPHLPNPEAGERYFASQSIWDDTMAWQAVEFMRSHPEQVLVIVVGDFHVQYGGGLPDRLRVRGSEFPVVTFSQVNTAGLTEDEIATEINPGTQDGPRADYLWLAPALSPAL
ncbi:ChaN family lipoprotein [Bdellovibrio bacteriovorus]|uniref:ChaN family lipoprotein n=1 Tax=Bdellovibrio bacteriovorus TaxID=959 RepID=UPI001E63A074|nr:ChaN family lipoprotein [Bdellovibrio bacteriovorus]